MIAFIGTWIFVPSTPADKTKYFDWVGFTTLVLGACLLQLAPWRVANAKTGLIRPRL